MIFALLRFDFSTKAGREAFYISREWAAMRKRVLREQPRCQKCRLKDSEAVDHIKDLATHPHLALTRENLQGLCAQCHNRKTGLTYARGPKSIGAVGIDGMPTDPRHPWNR